MSIEGQTQTPYNNAAMAVREYTKEHKYKCIYACKSDGRIKVYIDGELISDEEIK